MYDISKINFTIWRWIERPCNAHAFHNFLCMKNKKKVNLSNEKQNNNSKKKWHKVLIRIPINTAFFAICFRDLIEFFPAHWELKRKKNLHFNNVRNSKNKRKTKVQTYNFCFSISCNILAPYHHHTELNVLAFLCVPSLSLCPVFLFLLRYFSV